MPTNVSKQIAFDSTVTKLHRLGLCNEATFVGSGTPKKKLSSTYLYSFSNPETRVLFQERSQSIDCPVPATIEVICWLKVIDLILIEINIRTAIN